MRIRGEAATGFQFAAKIFELLHREAAFEEGARVDAWRGVALEVQTGIAFELGGARAEKMVETDFVERGGAFGGM